MIDIRYSANGARAHHIAFCRALRTRLENEYNTVVRVWADIMIPHANISMRDLRIKSMRAGVGPYPHEDNPASRLLTAKEEVNVRRTTERMWEEFHRMKNPSVNILPGFLLAAETGTPGTGTDRQETTMDNSIMITGDFQGSQRVFVEFWNNALPKLKAKLKKHNIEVQSTIGTFDDGGKTQANGLKIEWKDASRAKPELEPLILRMLYSEFTKTKHRSKKRGIFNYLSNIFNR